jgi:23S rRNA G2069 N7-methylase RlmK/C1962 C5-methylase RlmI
MLATLGFRLQNSMIGAVRAVTAPSRVGRVKATKPLSVSDTRRALPVDRCIVYLNSSKGKLSKSVGEGNPLVFADTVRKVFGTPEPGSEVTVKDEKDDIVGRGFYNPFSMYRVRLIANKDDKLFGSQIEELIFARIQQAIAMRRSLQLPRTDTTVYRLVNGEGDQLSGLIIDVLGKQVVIESSAIWTENHRKTIEDAVRTIPDLEGKAVIWRPAAHRLKQDGLDLTATNSTGASGTATGCTSPSSSIDSTSAAFSHGRVGGQHAVVHTGTPEKLLQNDVVMEHGIKYFLSADSDQKTGFYCDQRENRLLVRSLSRGKRVLDTYCYTGGFSLNALDGGAASVLAVDSSAGALQALRANCGLNNRPYTVGSYTKSSSSVGWDIQKESGSDSSSVAPTPSKLILPPVAEGVVVLTHGDAMEIMKQLHIDGKSFDLVICDPPKLAPSSKSLYNALKKYQRINALAMQLVDSEKGGLLLTCSCSAAMTRSGKFKDMLMGAAAEAGRRVALLSASSSGPDHPIWPALPEAQYLTAMLVHVLPR